MLILSGRTPGREIDEGTWIKMRVNMIKSNVLSLPGLTLSQKNIFLPNEGNPKVEGRSNMQ